MFVRFPKCGYQKMMNRNSLLNSTPTSTSISTSKNKKEEDRNQPQNLDLPKADKEV